jgi:hypothetical protein
MTFDLYVVDADAPDLAAVQALLFGAEDEDEGELTPRLAALCGELAAAHPFGEDGDGSPWASWPLEQPMAGGRACAFNLVWSQVEVGVDAVVGAAARHGLTVYDPQVDQVVSAGERPDLPPPNWWETGSAATAPPRRRWWRRGKR